MGEIQKGANGGFSGKAGSVIGASWRGIDYIKGLSKRSNKAATQAQVEQRLRFTAMTAFLAPLKKLLEKSYSSQDTSRATGYNLSLGDNLNKAIKGTYPDFEIDFSKVIISRGALTGVSYSTMTSDKPGVVAVSWSDFSNGMTAFDTDEANIIFYNTTKKVHLVNIGAAKRKDGKVEVPIPLGFSGDTLEGLFFFTSEDGHYSKSEYLGQATVF